MSLAVDPCPTRSSFSAVTRAAHDASPDCSHFLIMLICGSDAPCAVDFILPRSSGAKSSKRANTLQSVMCFVAFKTAKIVGPIQYR